MNNINENASFGSPTPAEPDKNQQEPQSQEQPQSKVEQAPSPQTQAHPQTQATPTVPPQAAQVQSQSAQQVQPTQQSQPSPQGVPSSVPPHAAHQTAPQRYAAPNAQSQAGGYSQQRNTAYQYQQPYQAHQPQHAQATQPAYQAPSTSTPPKKKNGQGKTFLTAFLGAALAVVIGLSGFGVYNAVTSSSDSSSSSSGSTIIGGSGSSINANNPDATLAEQVAEKVLPSVVNIDVYASPSSYGMFGGGSGELEESSLGSGVIISEDGYIITNYHVIEGGEALEVAIGGETYEAEVVGYDASSDIAVIKVDATGLTAVEIGSSSDLVVGEWVMSVGSPFGLEQSVATGIVSATSRSQIMQSETTGETTIYTNLIQTDAAINPGNSGGALVDSDGKLIGINTLITSYSGNYSGVGFAIPIDYAISLAQQIIDGETPSHAQLGVSLSTVNASIADRYGLAVSSGAYVSQVYSGSAADNAGIEEGDIITKFNGQAIASASDLMVEVRSVNPGDTVSVEISRNGQTMTLEVTLGSDAQTQQMSGSSLKGIESYSPGIV